MIYDADASLGEKTIIITKNELFVSKSKVAHGIRSEAQALVDISKAKGAHIVLALIKGAHQTENIKRKEYAALTNCKFR